MNEGLGRDRVEREVIRRRQTCHTIVSARYQKPGRTLTSSENEHARLARILEQALERGYVPTNSQLREVMGVVQRLALRRVRNHSEAGEVGRR
jgi:hypothetical protein